MKTGNSIFNIPNKKKYLGKISDKYNDKNKVNIAITDLKNINFNSKEKEVKLTNKIFEDNNKIKLIERINKGKIQNDCFKKIIQEKNNDIIYKYNQLNIMKQKEKENLYIKLDIKKNKELFDPKTKIIKRMPSVKQKLVPKFSFQKKNEDKNSIIKQFLPKQAVHRKSIAGVIGLSSIGSIPYMNAIIQCLSNVPNLRKELLKKDIYENLKKSNDKKFSFALAEVFYNLWKKLSQSIYKPKNFAKIINKMNPNNNKMFMEPKNFLIFLLNEMNKELNNVSSELNLNEIKQKESQNNNNNDYINNINNIKKNFENTNNSIITKEFNGYFNNYQKCLKCNMISQKIQDFKILSFSLDDIRKFKNYNIKYVSIYECFEFYQKIENLQLYPHECGGKIINNNQLLFMPKTLIINFEYLKDIQNNVNIIFEEFLNLRNYCMIINDSPYYYELIGVISCLNSNEKGNYYVAYCKNSNDFQWYKFNDIEVTKSSFKEIIGQPFILFFSYIQA